MYYQIDRSQETVTITSETDDLQDPAITMLMAAQGSFHPFRHGQRLHTWRRILEAHPDARLITCHDEWTGQRFGRARCRRGHAAKVGHTSWSPTYTGRPYQLWAVWEEEG